MKTVRITSTLTKDMTLSQVVEKYDKIVRKEAYQWSSYGDPEDLYQVGMVSLVKAYNCYDSSKGATFGTYLAKSIENEIKQYLNKEQKHNGLFRLNDNIFENDEELVDFIVYNTDDLDMVNYHLYINKLYESNIIDKRDLEILLLILDGKQNFQIARKFNVTDATISMRLKRMRKKIEKAGIED